MRLHLPLPALEAFEQTAHGPIPFGQGQKGITKTDQAARRDIVLDAHIATSVSRHIHQLRFADGQRLRQRADKLIAGLDDKMLNGLKQMTILILVGHHLGTRDLEFVAFASQSLDQHREVQFATAGDNELVGRLAILDTQADVRLQFAVEPLAQLTRGREFSFRAREWAGINAESDLDGWLGDSETGQRFGIVAVSDGLADIRIGNAGQRHNVACERLRDLDPLQPTVEKHLRNLLVGDRTVATNTCNLSLRSNTPARNASDSIFATVVVVIQSTDEHLQRRIHIHGGSRDRVDDRIQQRLEILPLVVEIPHRDARTADCVQDGEVQLGVVRCQFEEEILYLFHNLLDACILTINLVDHNDRLEI